MMNSQMTFDTFIEGESNQFAVAGCKSVATQLNDYYNPLWLYGPTGCGKSHLLRAICHHLEAQGHPNILYMSVKDLAESLVDLLSSRPSTWGAIEQAEVLVVDNMECMRGCKEIQKIIGELFIKKSTNGQQVICASNCPPAKLKPLYEALQKGGERALIADIRKPEKQLRADYIRAFLKRESMEMTEEAVEYLGHRFATIPQIRGVLTAAKYCYVSRREPVDVAALRKCLFCGRF